MTYTERRPIIPHSPDNRPQRINFSEIVPGIPLTITATDALTHRQGSFTILPLSEYKGFLLTSVACRYLEGDFNFNLFGTLYGSQTVRIGGLLVPTASGNLLERHDFNHYDNNAIQTGELLDLGFYYVDDAAEGETNPQMHHVVAHEVGPVKKGTQTKELGAFKEELDAFTGVIEATNRL